MSAALSEPLRRINNSEESTREPWSEVEKAVSAWQANARRRGMTAFLATPNVRVWIDAVETPRSRLRASVADVVDAALRTPEREAKR